MVTIFVNLPGRYKGVLQGNVDGRRETEYPPSCILHRIIRRVVDVLSPPRDPYYIVYNKYLLCVKLNGRLCNPLNGIVLASSQAAIASSRI